MIGIREIIDSEKLAIFTEGLEPHTLLEVQHSSSNVCEEAAKIAKYVDEAFYTADFFSNRGFGYNSGFQNDPVPMNIDIVQRKEISPKRLNDLKNDDCFQCHKLGYRPWKHNNGKNNQKEKTVQENNTEVKSAENDSGPQGN